MVVGAYRPLGLGLDDQGRRLMCMRYDYQSRHERNTGRFDLRLLYTGFRMHALRYKTMAGTLLVCP